MQRSTRLALTASTFTSLRHAGLRSLHTTALRCNFHNALDASLASIQPRFTLASERIRILQEPKELYDTLIVSIS